MRFRTSRSSDESGIMELRLSGKRESWGVLISWGWCKDWRCNDVKVITLDHESIFEQFQNTGYFDRVPHASRNIRGREN
jgi:hypothetical protein